MEAHDILVTGGTGFVGRRLQEHLPGARYLGSSDLDLRDGAAVAQAIAEHLQDRARRHAVLTASGAGPARAAAEAIAALASRLQREGVRAAAPLIHQGELAPGEIRIALDADTVATAAGLAAPDLAPDLLAIVQPFRCRRRRVETKIVAGDRAPAPDTVLLRALRNAHAWAGKLRAGTPLGTLARSERVSERYMARIIHLAGLSPRLQDAIVAGTQPADLTLKALLRRPLPLDWDTQERQFGFPG